MAQARTTPRAADAREARIGGSTRIRGRIHGEGDLLIEGHVEGDVAIRGSLTIAEGASVASEVIEAHAVTIAGALQGDVSASGPVRLAPGARVQGDLRGTAVSIDDGARFSGRLDCEFDLPPELGGTPRGESRARGPARR
ncbi:MAG TPA: polymer-forming cytoskeletal protein [Polyangiaceae bacterium]|nr:polymer-forming cytoskeletal protein [Polyangiaceae bacterium]